MKRPKKKEIPNEEEREHLKNGTTPIVWDTKEREGYNSALSDMDEYLPSEEEITSYIKKHFGIEHISIEEKNREDTKKARDMEKFMNWLWLTGLAKAISKRIRE